MLNPKLTARISQLSVDRTAFVLATVVRAKRPTSVRPGDRAIVLGDGTIEGFVGGVCAESSVRLYSLRAMETGEALLLRLVPDDDQAVSASDNLDGAVVEHNPCLSGGALEIFLEPQLPPARLVIVGGSPIAEALEQVADAAGYAVRRCAPGEAAEAGELEGTSAVIVAAHGNGEERALESALLAGIPYVALVASPTRGTAIRESLEIPGELAAQLHTPAGLDIGARSAAEIAISILAQMVAEHHADPRPERPVVSSAPASATDPICGMQVSISAASTHLDLNGMRVYFCGPGCRDAYAAQHAHDAAPG
jgi:xanthine dehydrogenase accessory factor